MTEAERLIYRNRVQALAVAMLRDATVQVDIDDAGVRLWLDFNMLGEALVIVPWEIDKLSAWLKTEILCRLQDMCRRRYFRE